MAAQRRSMRRSGTCSFFHCILRSLTAAWCSGRERRRSSSSPPTLPPFEQADDGSDGLLCNMAEVQSFISALERLQLGIFSDTRVKHKVNECFLHSRTQDRCLDRTTVVSFTSCLMLDEILLIRSTPTTPNPAGRYRPHTVAWHPPGSPTGRTSREAAGGRALVAHALAHRQRVASTASECR